MKKDTRIAVVGAGLGGMTAAGFLHRLGFENVAIYEQAPTFSRIGAGIILSPNVTKILRRLGLEDYLIDSGIKARCYISREWDTGAKMYEIQFNAGNEARFGGPYVNIHRGDLHAVMHKGLASGMVAFDHKLKSLEAVDAGVNLVFQNGIRTQADIVVGADGLNSRVRESLFGIVPLRFAHAVAIRAIFPAAKLNGLEMPDCTKFWGRDRHILVYYITARRDEVYVIGVIPWEGWDSDQSWQPSSRAHLLDAFAGFHPDLQRVMSEVDEVTLWPIYDRPRIDTWCKDRIALLGDACHPVPPYMGAGGAAAIEDGAVLARCIAECESYAEAFALYEKVRVDRVGHVQRISWENSWMRGPTSTDWFYCYDACTDPLVPPAGP